MECPHCRQEIEASLLAAQLGRKGGSQTSAAKKLSSKKNGLLGGRLGGRPKKKKAKLEVSDYWALRFYAEHGHEPNSAELRKYKINLTR